MEQVPVWIGGRGSATVYNFDGTIDDVQVFERALSVTEIGWLHGLSYDKNGNLASDGLLKYYYDCENRLMEVNDANDDAVASYRYDFAGRRVSKTVGGVTTKYVYDGDQVIAEYDGNNTLLRKFVYGPGIDEPICMVDIAHEGAIYYYHYDGLGSVVALSDGAGDIVERYTYDVFGEPTIYDVNDTVISESGFGSPYSFTGRRLDPETGLYYYRFRYYDPRMGRFLQTDPIGYGAGLNLYSYVANNPITFVDPYGLCKAGLLGTFEDRIAQLGEHWDRYLSKHPKIKDFWEGKYVGAQYGEKSANWYARKYLEAKTWYGKAGYYTAGSFASLWTPKSWKTTALTLGPSAAGVITKVTRFTTVVPRITLGADGASAVYIKTVSRFSGRTIKVVQKVTATTGKVIHEHTKYTKWFLWW